MTKPRRVRGGGRLVMGHGSWALLLMLMALLVSCNEKNKADTQTLPKVTDLAPAGTEKAEGGGLTPVEPVLDPDEPPVNARARLSVERLMFRRSDWKVDVALRSLEEAKLESGAGRALRESGFHVSQLPMNRLGLFRANLPGPVSLDVMQIMPMADYSPVTLVARIKGRRVGRAGDGAGQLQTVTMNGGAYRLLARLAADSEGHTLVDMVPQHYAAKVTAELRTPGERVMDGTVFDAMRVKQAIAAGQVWLIWAEAPPTQTTNVSAQASGSEGGMEMDQPVEDVQPPLLGTMMLNGLRGQQAVRMVLVVYVTE